MNLLLLFRHLFLWENWIRLNLFFDMFDFLRFRFCFFFILFRLKWHKILLLSLIYCFWNRSIRDLFSKRWRFFVFRLLLSIFFLLLSILFWNFLFLLRLDGIFFKLLRFLIRFLMLFINLVNLFRFFIILLLVILLNINIW